MRSSCNSAVAWSAPDIALHKYLNLLQRLQITRVEVSARHVTRNVRADGSFYIYGVQNFVYLAPTHNERTDQLTELAYLQGNSRFVGADGSFDVRLPRHHFLWPSFLPSLWLNGG